MAFDVVIRGYNSFKIQLVLNVPGKDIEEACRLVAAKYDMNWVCKSGEGATWGSKPVFFAINPHVNTQSLRSILGQIERGNADQIDGLIMIHENDDISVKDWVCD